MLVNSLVQYLFTSKLEGHETGGREEKRVTSGFPWPGTTYALVGW